jgi:hypothetical protein
MYQLCILSPAVYSCRDGRDMIPLVISGDWLSTPRRMIITNQGVPNEEQQPGFYLPTADQALHHRSTAALSIVRRIARKQDCTSCFALGPGISWPCPWTNVSRRLGSHIMQSASLSALYAVSLSPHRCEVGRRINGLAGSGSRYPSIPLVSAPMSNGRAAEKNMAQRKGGMRVGCSRPNLIRYVESNCAPWEKPMAPSNGPSSAMYISSCSRACNIVSGSGV